MDILLIYFFKSSGLLILFYFAYIVFMQKDTFFSNNRWFLLSGLITSTFLPLIYITKFINVEQNQAKYFNTVKTELNNSISNLSPIETINWYQIGWFVYVVICTFLILKTIIHLVSLFRFIQNKQCITDKPFVFIDINHNINPFSFFNYIVYNSTKYSENELNAIINHEKVHAIEKHSIDILLTKLFCAIFWFNPFVWLYKKAVLQNLEYIADQKACKNIEDKKVYQMTLLKVITDHNCFSITNNFYQSLIKKRIIMLNKNQSKKVSSWKYFIIVPVLVGFVALYQVKVVAQEKSISLKNGDTISASTIEVFEITIDKNSTDTNIKKDCQELKRNFNVDLFVTKIRRNSKKEIISISIKANDNKGSNSTHDIESTEAIKPFMFSYKRDINGKGEFGFYDENYETDNFDDENDLENPPTIPALPDAISSQISNNVYYLYVIDGKKMTHQDFEKISENIKIESMNVLKDKKATDKYGEIGKYGVIEIKTTN